MSLSRAQRDRILTLHAQHVSVDQTARLMKLPEPLIAAVIRSHDNPTVKGSPEFLEPLFR